MNQKLINCKSCNAEIAKSAKVCPHCGAKNKKPFYTKFWFWLLILFFIGIIAGANSGDSNSPGTSSNNAGNESNPTISTKTSAFDGDCGITATAEIGNNIINYPELSITITNTTDKEISAIKFYAVPFDVYGDEIKSWTTQSDLYTDTPIAAGKTSTVSYQLIEQSVKTVKLYVYSVYFADGTEWGDKDATKTKIVNEASVIAVDVKN